MSETRINPKTKKNQVQTFFHVKRLRLVQNVRNWTVWQPCDIQVCENHQICLEFKHLMQQIFFQSNSGGQLVFPPVSPSPASSSFFTQDLSGIDFASAIFGTSLEPGEIVEKYQFSDTCLVGICLSFCSDFRHFQKLLCNVLNPNTQKFGFPTLTVKRKQLQSLTVLELQWNAEIRTCSVLGRWGFVRYQFTLNTK